MPNLRAVLQPLDTRVQVNLSLVNDRLQLELDQPRTLASMAGAVAGLALALAVIGIYGVTSFVTGQRRREIGVRLAVGAMPADVVRLLLAEGLRPILIGLACGIGAALIAAQAFQGAMYGMTARDPGAFAAAAVILLVAAVAAVVFPDAPRFAAQSGRRAAAVVDCLGHDAAHSSAATIRALAAARETVGIPTRRGRGGSRGDVRAARDSERTMARGAPLLRRRAQRLAVESVRGADRS